MTAPTPKACECPIDCYSSRHMTYFKRNKFAYSWTIHDFSDWVAEAEGTSQLSPIFPGSDAEYRWKLEFRFSGNGDEGGADGKDQTYFGMFLKLLAAPKAVNVKFQIIMRNTNDSIITQRTSRARRIFKVGGSWGWVDYIARDMLENLSNNVLDISCRIEATAELITAADSAKVESFRPRNDLGNDLMSLVEGEKYGDVTILVGGQTFLAYKGILAARSPVFASMFNHEMAENILSTVIIDDVDEVVFKVLLKYIYTNKIDKITGFEYQLFDAADKYCLLSLKAMCQHYILANLSITNAAKTLQFAEVHQATEMKTRVLQFLGSGAARGVAETAGWKALADTHPQLVKEAFEAITS